MGKTVYCLSNGSATQFPNNSLTTFGNKFPFFIDYQKLTDDFKFHIALEGIGFSLNFERSFLPKHAENPSIIFVLKTQVKKPSICISLSEGSNHVCDVEFFDSILQPLTNSVNDSFVYVFLETDDLQYDKLANFFLTFSEYLDINVVHKTDKKLVKLIHKQTNLYSLININLLDHLKVDNYFYNDTGSARVQELVQLWKEKENRLKVAKNLNGDQYYYFRIDEYTETHIDLNTLLKPNLPKLVKVKCEDIRNQIFNNHHSKDLIAFCPEIGTQKVFFWHEFEAKTYCVLQNTILNTISFQITDENDKPLQLVTGVPTLLKLDIQAMEKSKKSFNVRITSTTDLHPENTRSNFTATLPQTLNLNADWKIGLSTVNLPNVFNTLPSDTMLAFIFYKEDNVKEKVQHFFPHKRYTKEELLDEINFFLIKNSKNVYLGEISETHPAQTHKNLCCIELKIHGTLIISKMLTDLLGFTSMPDKRGKVYFTYSPTTPSLKSTSLSHKFTSEVPINMDYYRPSYYMLYSNIVQPTAVSGEYLNILKIFPVTNDNSTYVIQEFKHREYLHLNNYDIKEIQFHLRSHTGEYISFDENNKDPIILNLNFTNYA